MSQANQTDIEKVKNVVEKHNGNIVASICELLKLKTSEDQKKQFADKTPIEQMREIAEEKDEIFHRIVQGMKKSRTEVNI